MPYPKSLLRGISDKSCITENNFIASHFFDFKINTARSDELSEASINWNDDDGASKVLLEQKNSNGDIQFRFGYVIMSLSSIDKICQEQIGRTHKLGYERAEKPENKYHGNLLCSSKMHKHERDLLRAALALNTIDSVEVLIPDQS
jgi:hypothetical protein